jgi:hypothetical protein
MIINWVLEREGNRGGQTLNSEFDNSHIHYSRFDRFNFLLMVDFVLFAMRSPRFINTLSPNSIYTKGDHE